MFLYAESADDDAAFCCFSFLLATLHHLPLLVSLKSTLIEDVKDFFFDDFYRGNENHRELQDQSCRANGEKRADKKVSQGSNKRAF